MNWPKADALVCSPEAASSPARIMQNTEERMKRKKTAQPIRCSNKTEAKNLLGLVIRSRYFSAVFTTIPTVQPQLVSPAMA
jgi:hypothetical protein